MKRINPLSLACLSASVLALSATMAQAGALDIGLPQASGIIVKYRAISQQQLQQARIASGAKALPARPADFAARTEQARALTGAPLQFQSQMGTGAYVFNTGKALSGSEALELARKLEKDPAVEYAEPDYIMQPMYTPSSPLYQQQQWDMQDAATEKGALNLPSAWDITKGSGVVVAVLDTGYRPHKDLLPNLIGKGYNFISDPKRSRMPLGPDGKTARQPNAQDQGDFQDGSLSSCPADPKSTSSWHGSHVAGTIAAAGGESGGLTGVAPKANILPVRVLGQCGGATSDIADGMLWAVGGAVPGIAVNPNKAQVLNMSLGGGMPCSRTYRDTIRQVNAQGSILVVAAGNAMKNARNTSPASCPGVITVAANGRSGGIASYSNYGAMAAVTAPGGDSGALIYSTVDAGATVPTGDGYEGMAGTSMATPHVAGVVALMLSVNAKLTWKDARKILVQTSRKPAAACEGCSSGLVDATAAVKAAQNYH